MFWGLVLSAMALVTATIYADNFGQRVMISAFSVAAGFFATAASVGPGEGFVMAVLILLGAILGPVVFSWSIAATVALIFIVKLQRLNRKP